MLSGSFTWPVEPPRVSAPSAKVRVADDGAVVAVSADVLGVARSSGYAATSPSSVLCTGGGGAGRSARSASSSAWVTGRTVPWRGLAGSL